MRMRTWPLAALLACAATMSACDGAREPEPEEVAAISEFDVGQRPAPGGAEVVRVILATGGLAEPGSAPMYADIAFFPIVAPEVPGRSYGPRGLRSRDVEPDLSEIDFDRQFAFLVAHPNARTSMRAMSSGQYATYFSSVRVSYPDDRILVHLSGSRLGGLDPVTALSARWEGSIYPIERRGRDLLEVRLDDNVYTYALAGTVQDAPDPDAPASDADPATAPD